jgi:single-stranded-DNA-specific exonuclease
MFKAMKDEKEIKEIKNLKKAAQKIIESVQNRENIIVYGDADLDGVAAVIICEESIKNLGGRVAALYFPDRESEGYGITKTALKSLKKFAPALIVAVDLGIGNFEEVKIAREAGFGTVIVDHHEILDGLPEADVVVDPKQEGDEYPFKFLCAAGLAFKLSEALLGQKMSKSLRESFLELVALATLADMMPRVEENKYFIDEGLKTVSNSYRPGIRAFFENQAFEFEEGGFNRKIGKMISTLNIRDVKKGLPAAYQLLCVKTAKQASELIGEFAKINQQRREKIKFVVEEIQSMFSKNLDPIVFGGSSEWDLSLLGTIASIICQQYGKPTFIYKILEKESQGTVRSVEEIDSVALMKKCKHLLMTYGGHPKASGFRVKNENLEKFKACLIENLPKTFFKGRIKS